MVADRDRSGKFRDRLSKPKKRQYEQDDDDQADEVNDAVHVISFRYELSDRIAWIGRFEVTGSYPTRLRPYALYVCAHKNHKYGNSVFRSLTCVLKLALSLIHI